MSHTFTRRNFLRTGLYGVAGAALAERCMERLVPEVVEQRHKVEAA